MASKSLGTLTLDLIAKIGGYTGPLDKAERKTKESTSNMSKYAKNAGIALAGIGVTAAAGLTALVKSSIDTADQLSKSSKIVGVAIEDLSGLKHAADLSGVSFQGLETGLIKLNRSTQEAFEGVGAGADAYKTLGINVKNTDGTLKSNYELLGEISDRFAGLEDGALKTSLAQDLLGKSGAKLIPLLNGGAAGLKAAREEAERLGLVFDEKTGTASEEFNDNMARLQKTLVGVGNTIAADVAPVLAGFTSSLADPKTQEGIAVLSSGLSEVLGLIGDITSSTISMYGAISSDLKQIFYGIDKENLNEVKEAIGEVRALIANPGLSAIFDPLAAVKYFGKSKEELQSYLGELLKAQAQIERNAPKIVKDEKRNIENFTEYNNAGIEAEINAQIEQRIDLQDELYKQQEELNESVADYADNYRRQLELGAEATELDKVRFEIANGALHGISEKQKQLLEDLAQELDLKKQLEELQDDLLDVQQELMTDEEKYQEAAAERLATLNAAREAGIISEQEYAKAVEASTDKLKGQIEELKKKENELDEFTKNAARSIQSELSDALVEGFDGGSGDILKRWGKLIQRMIADAVAADLTRALFGQGSLGEGQFGTAQLISGIGGIFAGFFDSGGSIPSGKVGVVGERGPELVRGPATVTGRIDTERQMRGNSVGNITMNFPGVTNAQEARKAAGAAGRELLAIINGAQRYT